MLTEVSLALFKLCRVKKRESAEQQCPRTHHHSTAAAAQSPVDRDVRSAAASGRQRGCSDVERSPTTLGRETALYPSGSTDSSVGNPVGRSQTRTRPTDVVKTVDHQNTDEQRCGSASAAGRKRRWSAPNGASDDEGKDHDFDGEEFNLHTLPKPNEQSNGRHKQRRELTSTEAAGDGDDPRTSPKCCREPAATADRGRMCGETAQLDYCNNNNNKEGSSMIVSNKMK